VVEVRVRYEGGLRCQATHGPSGATLSTDAPVDNHGKGEAFSPTDLVATALGTCILTVMGIAAERHGWSIEGAQATVEKRMVADPARRIAALEVVVRMPSSPDQKARTILERIARACPVHHTLSEHTKAPVRFEWGVPV
jgi:putative redox protein